MVSNIARFLPFFGFFGFFAFSANRRPAHPCGTLLHIYTIPSSDRFVKEKGGRFWGSAPTRLRRCLRNPLKTFLKKGFENSKNFERFWCVLFYSVQSFWGGVWDGVPTKAKASLRKEGQKLSALHGGLRRFGNTGKVADKGVGLIDRIVLTERDEIEVFLPVKAGDVLKITRKSVV